MHKYFSILQVLLFVLPCSAQIKEADISCIKNKHLDLPYATLSESQKLDIYLPENSIGPYPSSFRFTGVDLWPAIKETGKLSQC